jgi:GR25 family glycosyltransferase involved in LPS biosynthesis
VCRYRQVNILRANLPMAVLKEDVNQTENFSETAHPCVLKTPQPILHNGLEKSQETVQHKACTEAMEKENFVQESSYHLSTSGP